VHLATVRRMGLFPCGDGTHRSCPHQKAPSWRPVSPRGV
jgi:hypothetical protein